MMVRSSAPWSAFVLALLMLSASPLMAQTTYRRTLELDPIALTQSDLLTVLRKVRTIVDAANAEKPSATEPEQRLTLQGGQVIVTVRGALKDEAVKRAPDTVTRVHYSFEALGEPVSNVTFEWAEGYRTISVEGTDADQVDAVFAVARDALELHRNRFTNKTIQGLSALFGILVAFGAMVWTIFADNRRLGCLSSPWLILAAFLTLLALGALPFTGWFPDTAVYAGEASFFARHSHGFGFWGFVLSIVGTILAIAGMIQASKVRPHVITRRYPDGGVGFALSFSDKEQPSLPDLDAEMEDHEDSQELQGGSQGSSPQQDGGL